MTTDFNDVKCTVSSLLTSSKYPVSIAKLRKDFFKVEGMNIPYESLGFNSDIELLQSMTDVLTLPQNPNSSSIMCLIVNEKTRHRRMFVELQKKNKIEKSKSYVQSKEQKKTNKKSNASKVTVSNTFSKNYQNRNNNNVFNTHYSNDNYNSRNQSSTSNNKIDINKKNLNQNETHSSGYVTKNLRAFLEYNLSHNQKHISIDKLKELIKSHKDFPALKTENMYDILNKLQHFLSINSTGVFLKKIDQFKTKDYIPLIYQPPDESRIYSMERNVNQTSRSDSHKNTLTNNFFNVRHKIVNTVEYGCDQYYEQDISSELKKLKVNDPWSKEVFKNNLNIFLDKTKHIPEKVEYNARIDPSAYGFTTAEQMFKAFNEFIDIRYAIMYPKPTFFMLYNYMRVSIDESGNSNQLINDILKKNNTLNISLDIRGKSLSFNCFEMHKMILTNAYNPSLFFLQLESNIEKFNILVDNMLKFYETENSNYCVKPEQIIPGFVYASSYTTFPIEKNWYRVRILEEVDSMTVKVIHVDYGTVDNIPKTEIRFLYHTFSELPSQAIHCCLDGYHELESLEWDVSQLFVNIIDKKPVNVSIDAFFCLESRYRILHVTLFECENKKNINFELTTKHLSRFYKAIKPSS